MAQEKSCLVLMFVEYALRRRAEAISSVASTKALRITSNLIGSMRVDSCAKPSLLKMIHAPYKRTINCESATQMIATLHRTIIVNHPKKTTKKSPPIWM